MSLYAIFRSAYHGVVPRSIRDRLFRGSPRVLKRVRRRFIRALEATAAHDEIYNDAYYRSIVDPTMVGSAESITVSVMNDLKPRSVIDVGCGTGRLLCALRPHGVRVIGLEYSTAAIDRCRAQELDVRRFDIENDTVPDLSVDLVISTEVAEHLPEACADRFVALLTALAPTAVVTAATPSDAGTDHVNEQSNEYWIEKFVARGMQFDSELSSRWRREWRESGVAGCFADSVMIFHRRVDDPGR